MKLDRDMIGLRSSSEYLAAVRAYRVLLAGVVFGAMIFAAGELHGPVWLLLTLFALMIIVIMAGVVAVAAALPPLRRQFRSRVVGPKARRATESDLLGKLSGYLVRDIVLGRPRRNA